MERTRLPRFLLEAVVLLALLALPLVAGSTVILVKPDGTGDYPAIQEAIDAAAEGDTVALDDGVFSGEGNRDLLFRGKMLTVCGLSGDPTRSVIDCGGQSDGGREVHRGVDFGVADTVGAILRDLTITNGVADGL